MVTPIPALYGSGKLESKYTLKAQAVERLMMSNENEEWDGSFRFRELSKNEKLRKLLSSILPPEQYSFSDEDRISYSFGKSSIEILAAKLGKITEPVEAVIFPDYATIEKLIRELDPKKYQIIPVGGASSVTGALSYSKGKVKIAVSTKNFKRVEFRENYVVLGSGYTGMEAEKILHEYGFTIGNFPESFEYSTLGGWVATKAIGQESNQYGGIENLIIGVKMIGSEGFYREEYVPRNSEGMDLKTLALGEEGKTGLITDVAFRLHKAPARRFFNSYFFRSYEEGIKQISRMKFYPSILRLSDEVETAISLDGEFDTPVKKLYEGYLKVTGARNGSMLIIVNNNVPPHEIPPKAISAGKSPAKQWIAGRYSRPALGNILWKRGMIPDTLETSTTWSNLYNVHKAVQQRFSDQIEKEQAKGIIMSHISHIYSSGACIYFTFVIWREDEQMRLLENVRDAIMRAFIENGCAVSHHHGPGRYLDKYIDEKIRSIRKRIYDPLFSED